MAHRDRDVEAARRDILAAGREVFSRRPYSDASAIEICDRAGVSCGALQRHFGSRRGLFMAVFESLQRGLTSRIVEALSQERECVAQVRAGIAAFLDACAEPAYQSVVLTDGPAVLGWERWLKLDTKYYGDVMHAIIDMLGATGSGHFSPGILAATLRGALTELSFEIAQSVDPAAARGEALAIIDCLLHHFNAPPANTSTTRPLRVGIRQLRTNLRGYLERAAAGEVIEVTRRGRVLVCLQPPAS